MQEGLKQEKQQTWLRTAFSFRRSGAALVLALLAGAITGSALAQTSLSGNDGLLSLPPRNWVEDATRNEVKVIQFDRFYLRYAAHISNARGVQVRDVVESHDGTVARMIEKDGRPLTAEEDTAERQRLQTMIESPEAFSKHIKGDVSGKKLALDMVKMMPDAMSYTYVPGQPQTERSTPHAPEIVLDFSPNPQWKPPTMSSEALTGFRGRIWIDSDSHTMVRMDGTIFQPINFGFGMVAHIFPGGTLSLEQTNAGQQHWIFSHFTEHLTLRALMLKTIRENSEIVSSDFHIIPSMSYQEAIHLLLNDPSPKP